LVVASVRTTLVGLALVLVFEGAAAACPFCGGKGASGFLENLVLVAGLWLGARALMRSVQRRRLKERPPERETTDAR
jgi:hypothetical protein